jgi:S1-C subfamily serine protease
MNRKFCLYAVAAMMISSSAHAQVIQLRGRQQIGQGFTRPRASGECYIVAPLHVVSDSTSVITFTAEDQVTGEARIADSEQRADLAVLQISASATINCPAWNIPADLSTRLSDASVNAVLRTRDGEDIVSTPVWIRRVQARHVTIEPRLAGDHLSAGMSGGQLLVNGAFAGILLSTADYDRQIPAGQGIVLRSDALDRILSGFFTTRPADMGFQPPAPLGVPVNEPDLWLRLGESVVLGDQGSAFGITRDRGDYLTVSRNGQAWGMGPGTRYDFPDSRGQCYIIYLRSEASGTRKRYAFAIRCTPK